MSDSLGWVTEQSVHLQIWRSEAPFGTGYRVFNDHHANIFFDHDDSELLRDMGTRRREGLGSPDDCLYPRGIPAELVRHEKCSVLRCWLSRYFKGWEIIFAYIRWSRCRSCFELEPVLHDGQA